MGKDDEAHTHTGILCSSKKEWDLAICANMEGPKGYYAEWRKSDRERQILNGFTYLWNYENKANEQTKQNKNRLITTETEGMAINQCRPNKFN